MHAADTKWEAMKYNKRDLMSGTTAMKVVFGANGKEETKGTGTASSGECAICLKHLDSSLCKTARCATCGIIVELDCIAALIKQPENLLTPTWQCPPCKSIHSVGPKTNTGEEPGRKERSVCVACGFTGGFLAPFREFSHDERLKYVCWIHPFCALFAKDIQKSAEELAFTMVHKESEKEGRRQKKNGRKSESQGRERTKEQACSYCERIFGYRKKCSKCRKNPVHAICAYRQNAIINQDSKPGGGTENAKLKAMMVLCKTCMQRTLAKSAEASDDGDNGVAGERRRVRKSDRLVAKAEKAKKALVSDAASSTSQPGRDEGESEPQKKQKKQMPPRMIGKLRCNFHPKSPSILMSIVDIIAEADALQTLAKDYGTLQISLGPSDLHSVKFVVPASVYYDISGPDLSLILSTEDKSGEGYGQDITKGEFYKQFQQFLAKKKPKSQLTARQFVSSINKTPPWVRRARNETLDEPSPADRKDSGDSLEEMKDSEGPDTGFSELVDVWIESSAVTNIEVLRTKVIWNYYYRIEDFLQDAKSLFVHTLRRCSTAVAKSYVSELYNLAQKLTAEALPAYHSQVDIDLYEFYRDLTHAETLRVAGTWSKKAMPKRQYFMVEEYIPGMEGDKSALERMKTRLQGECDGKHCQEFAQLGPLDLAEDAWKSECPDRRSKLTDPRLYIEKIECDREHCGCREQECKNRFITDHKRKTMGVDVQEIESWGLDWFTIRYISSLFPGNITDATAGKYVEEKLNRALQTRGTQGWDIRRALRYIIESREEPVYTARDKKFSEHLLKIIRLHRQGIDAFRVHSKGIGIICTAKEGIKCNELIHEYFGEIYTPWRWYEKQDIIKKGQNEGKILLDLPDFYNIMLERHKFDPDGYDILFVDPISKGSYCSRFSHSCNPNCSTVVMAADGRYSIGMYALRDINYGEELTFDYSSFTDNEKEYQSAVCLCCSFNCRGTYLGLANTNTFDQVIQSDHTFLERIYLIYKAIAHPTLEPSQSALLEKHGIKHALIGDAPDWLKKWVALVLEFVEFELNKLPTLLAKEHPEIYDLASATVQARGVQSIRIQNLAITIDKVLHLLREMHTTEPPIFPLSEKEIYMRFWTEERSIRAQLLTAIESIKQEIKESDKEQSARLENMQKMFLGTVTPVAPPEGSEEDGFALANEVIRRKLLELSETLREVKCEAVQTFQLCDILFLYAHTKSYFTPNAKYTKIVSTEVQVRLCDVTSEKRIQGELTANDQANAFYRGTKEYDSSFVCGQLAGWFKQTVDKPNASLSAERRGTLSYPDIESFILKKQHEGAAKQTSKHNAGHHEEEEEEDKESSPNRRKKAKKTGLYPIGVC